MRNENFWTWFESYAAPKLAEFKGMDRSGTFRKMFEHLDGFDRQITIIETGCMEDPDNWGGNGCSTILFNEYAKHRRGTAWVHSIEIDVAKVHRAQKLCGLVDFMVGDSVKRLKDLCRDLVKPDLLYLDASHFDWFNETPAQVHHYNELMAILPMLRPSTLVVVDDSVKQVDDYPQQKIVGKGGLVAQYALEVGATMKFCEYQVGFTDITSTPPTLENFGDIILRARSMVERGETLAADRLYRLILILSAQQPRDPKVRIGRGEACANFARQAHQMRRYGIAADWFRAALESDPLAGDYHVELARSLMAMGAMNGALREAEIATEVEPDNSLTWRQLGDVYADRREANMCRAAYDMEIVVSAQTGTATDVSNAYLNRATIAMDTEDYKMAELMCGHILKLGVHPGDAWHVLAMLAYRHSKHEESIAWFDKALKAPCRNLPLCHWNKAMALHAIGRIKEGWAEHEWRKHETTFMSLYLPHHRFAKPKWSGEEFAGTVHVHTEAGHGDNICMLRYLPLLRERGLTVHYESDEKLTSLAARSFPDVVVMDRAKNYPGAVGLQPFDWHIPIGDLPHAFGTDIDSMPWRGPYLQPDESLVHRFENVLWKVPNGRRIGLCWSSGIRKNVSIWMERYGKSKSMHFEDMRPLLNGDDVFVSLQVGDGRNEIDHRIDNVQDLLSADPDWDETAALIANLDLVITVDTGVAHLAGAMGVETWVVMQRDGSSWHFMCERPGAVWNERSPWYPSVRVFRQSETGGWASAIAKVAAALQEESVAAEG
jgi:tetratricopeptide (TPR) repeat protein